MTQKNKEIKKVASAIVEKVGEVIAAGLVEYANLVKQLADDLTIDQIQDTTKIKELLSKQLPNWDAEDWEDLRAAVVKEKEAALDKWEQTEVAVTLTNGEWGKLAMYLLMSTNFRKGEVETWERLAKEKGEDGKPRFESAESNAEFWREVCESIEKIRDTINNRQSRCETQNNGAKK